jgi:hypothetical protein
MTSIFSLRRSLSILVVVVGFGLMSLAPAAEARLPARPVAPRSASHALHPAPSLLAHLWRKLHRVWEATGSSMDPLGHH